MRLSHRIPSLRSFLTLSALLVGAFCVAAPVGSASAAKRADLSITSNKLSSTSIVRGGNLTSTIRVKNKGKKSSAKSVAGFWISYDGKYSSGDVLAGSAKVAKLAPGKSREAKLTIQIPVDFPAGTFYMVACADGDKKIKESSEKNNCRAAKVSITEQVGPTGPPDGDGDGVPDSSDNCPANTNQDQTDVDNDGTGDACDVCAGSVGCPVTVSEVRTGTLLEGARVRLSGIIVTAIDAAGTRVWAQEPGVGGPNKGIELRFSSPPDVQLGNEIQLDGNITSDFMLSASSLMVTSAPVALPSPVTLTASDFSASGTSYHGVLIAVESVAGETYGTGDWRLTDSASPTPPESSRFVVLNEILNPLTNPNTPGLWYLKVTGIGAPAGIYNAIMPRTSSDIISPD